MKNYKVTTTAGDGTSTETIMQLPELGDPCAKCGLNPSTQEVTIMVEHSGGAALWCDECAKGPEWTKDPPKEPGKWFWRFVGETETHVAELDSPASEDYPFDFEDPTMPREWWPVRIEEPPR